MADQTNQSLIDITVEKRERRFLTIDGKKYELKDRSEFPFVELQRMAARFNRMKDLLDKMQGQAAEGTEADADEARGVTETLRGFVSQVLIGSNGIVEKLSDQNCVDIVSVFSPRPSGDEEPTSAKHSPDSSDSTEAA
jgi:hypothetical protein